MSAEEEPAGRSLHIRGRLSLPLSEIKTITVGTEGGTSVLQVSY